MYQAWALAYTQRGQGAKVNYQSVGSSADIATNIANHPKSI